MLGAILYLRLTSLKNFVLARLRRLRQPKYFIGAIVGVAYFYFFFFRHTRAPSTARGPQFFSLPPDSTALFLAAGALALLVILVCMWVLPSDRPGLRFSEAEIAFLFPAPISRQNLIHYRVLSSQFTTLFQSLLYALLFNTRLLFSTHALQIIFSWWALLSVVSLHYHGSSLTIARLAESGVGRRRRRLMVAALVAAILAAASWSLWQGLVAMPDGREFFSQLPTALTYGALPWLLWPFELIVQPFFAREPLAFVLALGPVLLVLALHYLWVVRMNVAFEDAAIEKAERAAVRVAEMRRTGTVRLGETRTLARPAPFDLARARWPEAAFLWKNLLSTTRSWFTPRAWLIAAAVILAISGASRAWLGHEYWKVGGGLATVGMVGGVLALLYGPLLTRLDLRQDLANADLLKTYPLPGWRILLGELLAPIAILTGLVWLALLAWYLGLKGHQPPALSTVWLGPDMRVVFALCAALVTPVIVAMELLVPNAVPILFPAWFQSLRTPGGGIDLMGQRLIFGAGQVVVVMLALLPAAASAGLLIFVTQWLIGPAASVIFATLIVLVVLLGELWCGLWWLGGRFEKFDLSAEPAP